MSTRQIRDEVVTIFFAGHETIAHTLTWAWYLLGHIPRSKSNSTRNWRRC